MCGLLGIIDNSGVDLSRAMGGLRDLHHRGPDAAGQVLLDKGRLFLGHTRLKVIDMSDGANQPFVSPCGRYTIVFNGEIVNFEELRKSVSDWRWRTKSDTEVLLALYARFGMDMLRRLNGMFAFCIYDEERRRTILGRDRFGIKPLYYVRLKNGWAFGSEIPPLLRQLDRVAADRRMIRTYLETALYDFGPNTFFEHVKTLEPGCWLEFNHETGTVIQERWYRLADQVPDLTSATEEELIEETERLVRVAIKDHLVADVTVGLNVSGGVDSSVLVRVALEQLGHAHLFTQDYEGYSEEPWVREIADGGTLHVERLTLESIDSVLRDVVRSQGEPFGGVLVCGYHYLYAAAEHAGVTVLLDGNGVDECFLGYKKYHQQYVSTASSATPAFVDEYRHFWGEAPRVQPRPDGSHVAVDGTLPTCTETISAALLRDVIPYQIPSAQEFSDPVKNAAASDLLYSRIPRGLRFNDRISMASSKELRVPFLDYRLVEFGMGVPTKFLLNGSGSKALFRKAAARMIPRSVAFASKRTVQSPQREWLVQGWRPFMDELLSSDSFRSRGWVDVSRAQQVYRKACETGLDNSFFLWQWLNLELWARQYLTD